MIHKRTSTSLAGQLSIEPRHLVRVPAELVVQVRQDLPDPERVSELAVCVRDKLLFGPGLALLHGEALATLSDSQLESLHWSLCTAFGRPKWQNSRRELVVRVENTSPPDPDRARGYISNTRMLMHTDGWDCAGLMCLSPSMSGGASLLACSEDVHDVLSGEAPELLKLLFEPWDWDVRFITGDPGRAPVRAPIFSRFQEELSCRYSSSMLRNGPSVAGRELTPACVKALDAFESIVSHPSMVLQHRLARGEAVWMNNYRVLHGREAFEDAPDGSLRRRMVRLWATINGASPRAPGFAAFDPAIFGEAEG